MHREAFIIRSSISPSLMRATLFRGCAIAFLGLIILLFAGSELSLEYLRQWGWSLFPISMGLITLGLLPYRRLSRLQLKPNLLVLLDSDHMAFFQRDKKLFSLPLQSIARINYIAHPHHYGIALWFTPSPTAPILIHHSSKEVENMRQQGKRIGNADLFFPYFNQYAYEECLEWLSIKAHFE